MAAMKAEMEEIDMSDLPELEKEERKARIMMDIASRMIDQARSIEMEADLMVKRAKEKTQNIEDAADRGVIPGE